MSAQAENTTATTDPNKHNAPGLPTPESSPEPETRGARETKHTEEPGGNAGPIRTNKNDSARKHDTPYTRPGKGRSKGEREKQQKQIVDEIMKCDESNYRGILGISEKGDDVTDEKYQQQVLESFNRRARLTNPTYNKNDNSKAAYERR